MLNHLKRKAFIALAASIVLSNNGCNNPTPINGLSNSEIKEGWHLLFDGKSLDQWHLYNKPTFKGAWRTQHGEIYCDPNEEGKRTDLVTNKEYENYDLKFEWKLAKEGNSGVFINVLEQDTLPTAWTTGPEYQLLEDSHPDIDVPFKRPGCLYGFQPQKNFVNTKKLGEWNQSRIIQQDGKVKFYLNEVLTAEMDFNSEEWKAAIKKSSFRDKPEFGVRTRGKIALQDWAHGVSFRNIKIKEL